MKLLALTTKRKPASLALCCIFVWLAGALLFGGFCFLTAPSFRPGTGLSLFHPATLRDELHNTWIFVAVFASLGIAGFLWVLIEHWRQQMAWTWQAALRMAYLEGMLFACTLLYGLGTNGVIARKAPSSVTISDVLGIAVVLALPFVVWKQWRVEDNHRSSSIFGLESRPTAEPGTQLEKPLQPQPVKSPIVKTEEYRPMTARPGFREQLSALNASWQSIEGSSKEIERWFRQQQQRVVAHLERRAPGNETAEMLDGNFVEARIQNVDAEWARIQQIVHEMGRWLENAPPVNQLEKNVKVG